MKILVTGGKGFVGRYVIERLQSIHIVENYDLPDDILDEKNLFEKTKGIDIVIHLAGIAHLEQCNNDAHNAINTNIMGTVNLLEACLYNKVKRIIYISSQYVFSRDGGIYKCCKKACEDIIREYQKQYGLDFTIVRCGSIYGKGADKNNYVYDLITKALKGELPIIGDETRREYIHVKDVAKGSDIIITCTPSSEAFLDGTWLKKGAHISAIGADTSAKRELMTSVIKNCDKHVVDYIPQAFVVGDFKIPKDEGIINEEGIYAELGEIVAGKKIGRESPDEITMFKATGLAIQDVSTASKVFELAKSRAVGINLV